MDPITLATVTTAVVTLALDAAKEAATEAAKDTWQQVKKWIGWEKEPAPEQLAPAVASRLNDDEELTRKIAALLKDQPSGSASTLVGSIKAGKVVVAHKIETVNM